MVAAWLNQRKVSPSGSTLERAQIDPVASDSHLSGYPDNGVKIS